jgi:hypothetical protein
MRNKKFKNKNKNYESKDEIENKLKFNKKAQNIEVRSLNIKKY